MKTADAYIQALQETTMTLIDSILMLAGPEFRKLKYLGCHHQYRIDHAETAKTKSGRNREGQT